VREITLADRHSTELLGPGDVFRPDAVAGLVPCEVAWMAFEPSEVAVLDERFALASRRWPALGAIVADRLAARSERLAVHLAIAQLPRVEQRVVAMLWHLADRWGRVKPDGVAVPLKLTHEAIGRLVGAQRPTVTLALASLEAAGLLHRCEDGWVLARRSRDDLTAPVRLNPLADGGVAWPGAA
jgi:CRP/FNR family transcriptional regulator, cyclic AMP receptor protein